MKLDSLRLRQRASVALDQDWTAKLRLSMRARARRGFDCRGHVQLHLDPSATIVAPRKNFIGVAVLGSATKRNETTVIVVESGAYLELAGVSVGRGSTLRVHARGRLKIGHRTFLNDGTNITVCEAVTIGEDCAISWGVTILDSDGHRYGSGPSSAAVTLGDRVWLGCNVTILKGVTIGSGSVVGAGAVVTRSCPPNSLLVGAPAHIAKSDVSWQR